MTHGRPGSTALRRSGIPTRTRSCACCSAGSPGGSWPRTSRPGRILWTTRELKDWGTGGPLPARPSLGGSMLPWSAELAGQLEEHVITSELLRDNPLGDPHERPLWVYLPPEYDDDPDRRYPAVYVIQGDTGHLAMWRNRAAYRLGAPQERPWGLSWRPEYEDARDRRYPAVYVIQGYTGHLAMWRNRAAYRQPFPETADGVFARGEAPPTLVVYVDAWTAYGGSQFVDSPGTGRYHSYLCDEIVPWVDGRYRTLPEAAHRAIMGKSSGGFGAMITPMLRPDLFGALATHAGDALYELSYLPGFGRAARLLRDYDGDIWRWWDDFRSRVAFTKEADHALLMLLGVAACFSAHEAGTVDLPFDPQTGGLRPDAWTPSL